MQDANEPMNYAEIETQAHLMRAEAAREGFLVMREALIGLVRRVFAGGAKHA